MSDLLQNPVVHCTSVESSQEKLDAKYNSNAKHFGNFISGA